MDLNQAADRVGGKLTTLRPTLKLDPAIITIIIEAIKELLPLFIEVCQKKSSELADEAKKLLDPKTLVDRLVAWRTRVYLARRVGLKAYKQAGDDDLFKAILEAAVEATPAEVDALYASLPPRTEPIAAKLSDFIPDKKATKKA